MSQSSAIRCDQLVSRKPPYSTAPCFLAHLNYHTDVLYQWRSSPTATVRSIEANQEVSGISVRHIISLLHKLLGACDRVWPNDRAEMYRGSFTSLGKRVLHGFRLKLSIISLFCFNVVLMLIQAGAPETTRGRVGRMLPKEDIAWLERPLSLYIPIVF